MFKKIIITLLIFFAPIAVIENHKKEKSSQIHIKNSDMIKKNNLKLVESLFDANEENSIEIKNCWEEGDLESQKRYCSSNDNFFQNF